MRKLTGFLGKNKYIVPVVILILAVFCAAFYRRVHTCSEFTAFLPEDSSVKKGMDILSEEFGVVSFEGTIRIMGRNLSDSSKKAIVKELNRLDNVKSVEYKYDSEAYNRDGYSLFVVNTELEFSSKEMKKLEDMISTHICPRYDLVYDTNETGIGSNLLLSIAATALLALATLSFQLGESMGTALTKVIFFSIIFVFAVLPSFVPIIRKRIRKTHQKESCSGKTRGLFSKIQMVFLVLLVLFFAAGLFLKANLKLRYFMPKESEISEIFPWNDTVRVLYDTKEEDRVRTAVSKLEKTAGIERMEYFSGMLEKKYDVYEMTEEIAELSRDAEIPAWMLRLVYFDQGGYEIQSMSLGEFLSIRDGFSGELPGFLADLENNLAGKRDILTVFADKNRLSESRPAAETAALFGIDGNLTAELYQLSGKERMSLAEFLQAIEDYSGAAAAVPSGLMEQIEMAALFTDREEYAKERTASELSQLFGVDESLLTKLLKLSGKKTASIESLITMISSNSLITSMLPSDITEKLYLVAILTNPDEMSKKRTADEVSNLLGIDRSLLSIMGNESMSIDELMQLAKKMAAVPDLTSMRESESFTRMRQIMSDTEKDKKYTSLEMTELLESMTGSRNEGEIALAYTVYASQKFPVINKMSLEQFFQYVTVMSESAEYAELFDDGVRKSLSKASGELADMRRQFVGEEHSVMTISILLSEEPEEIDKLYDAINKTLRKSVRGKYYLVGNIPLQRELEKDYAREFNGIWIPMAVLFILPGAVELSGRGIRRIRKK